MKVLITGSGGLLGTHMHALLEAQNCAAAFHGKEQPFDICVADRHAFKDIDELANKLEHVEAIFHFAGINRGTRNEVANGNQEIATKLVAAITAAGVSPHIVYANSTHSMGDSAYGKGKSESANILSAESLRTNGRFSDLVLPHIFGEGGEPYYNSVTSTLCHQLSIQEQPTLSADGRVELLHAGEVARIALKLVTQEKTGVETPAGTNIGVVDLYETLQRFYNDYVNGLLPEIDNDFQIALFNTLRSYMFPGHFPVNYKMNEDNRGVLFEAVKGGAGQTFLSWTKPGVTRGDHFHLNKVERFAVVSGEAVIRIRHIFKEAVHEFPVSGNEPVYIDMPTMYTHSIENTGDTDLLTLFWANEIFDPGKPDTYALKVLETELA